MLGSPKVYPNHFKLKTNEDDAPDLGATYKMSTTTRGRRDPAKAAHEMSNTPLNERIREALSANDTAGTGALERKNSAVHLLDKRDAIYRQKEVRLSMGEFVLDVDFALGIPRIILDVI